MQSSKSYRKLKGFTLIESMLGIMVIGLVSGSIMLGITTVEKKLFKIRLKEQAFETLRNYTNFLGSRIAVGDIPGKPPDSGLDVAIYKNEVNNIVEDIYTANMNYTEVSKLRSELNHNGEVYALNTFIIWPNESDLKDTLRFYTFQIKLTN
ncbi:type II secretion system protein [Candidatus Marinimicrobia bacterium PRS2]|nr:type II secretion system protein [Candidatus Marinimicrobia bacterium PRS2]